MYTCVLYLSSRYKKNALEPLALLLSQKKTHTLFEFHTYTHNPPSVPPDTHTHTQACPLCRSEVENAVAIYDAFD